jgi:hypothetical protein
MKISVIYIINNKEDIKKNLDNIETILKNERYEIILVNNILNYHLDKYYENNTEHVKIIDLSKDYNYIDSLMAGIMLAKGKIIISLTNNYSFNSKNIMDNLINIKNNKYDQTIYYNESKKELFKETNITIGAWLFNSYVKDALTVLYNKNINIDFNEIGFVTNKIIDENILINYTKSNGYFLIRNKIGFEESIL